MSIEVIRQRLRDYSIKTEQDEKNALKEVSQEIILAALSRSEFFKFAAFQGGTCLRIMYGLDRFSEDLDFVLKVSDLHFDFSRFLVNLSSELSVFGYDVEITDRSRISSSPIQKVFLKDSSIGKILEINGFNRRSNPEKIRIKLEVDTNPPANSAFDEKILAFPFPFTVLVQDLPSLFASKSHALLCRPFVKGRDWYDFIWYCSRRTAPNYRLLSSALNQVGPWKEKHISVSKEWYLEAMTTKINGIDWAVAATDVQRFLRPHQVKSLDLWSASLFLECLHQMI